MSSGGLFFLLHALRTSPPHHFSTIVLITGLYPVVTAVIGHFFLDAKLNIYQWIGVVLAGVALWLITWEK
jgi:drug/metabolite transporter (DMT)-like permease